MLSGTAPSHWKLNIANDLKSHTPRTKAKIWSRKWGCRVVGELYAVPTAKNSRSKCEINNISPTLAFHSTSYFSTNSSSFTK